MRSSSAPGVSRSSDAAESKNTWSGLASSAVCHNNINAPVIHHALATVAVVNDDHLTVLQSAQ